MKTLRVIVTFFVSWFVASIAASTFLGGLRVAGTGLFAGASLLLVIAATVFIFGFALLYAVNWVWSWKVWSRSDDSNASNGSAPAAT